MGLRPSHAPACSIRRHAMRNAAYCMPAAMHACMLSGRVRLLFLLDASDGHAPHFFSLARLEQSRAADRQLARARENLTPRTIMHGSKKAPIRPVRARGRMHAGRPATSVCVCPSESQSRPHSMHACMPWAHGWRGASRKFICRTSMAIGTDRRNFRPGL